MRLGWRRALAAALALLALGCSERFEWRELAGDGFMILLPGRPQSVTRDIEIAGERVPMTMWSTGTGATMFAVGEARLPKPALTDPAAREAALAYFRNALVRNIGAPAALSRDLPSSGAARKPLAQETFEAFGRTADGRKSRLAARLLIVDDRFFQLVALGAEGEIPPQAIETFFTSFRLTP